MRILEAFLACGLLVICHNVISKSSVSTLSTSQLELETLGQNLLNTLEDQELLMSHIDQGETWESSLRLLIEAILPPDVLYNVSIESLVSGETLAEDITNIDPEHASDLSGSTSVQGLYTFSYPLVKITDVLLDIVIVLDRSGSMGDPIPGDPENKIYYAKEAACNFIDKLNSTTDRVGLVSFHTTTSVEADLTDDFESVKTTINNLPTGGWTNMGGGISDSNLQFENYGRDNATWVMILLSDGKANRPEPEEYARTYALEQAEVAEGMGVKIYTIGLGSEEDIDEDLLKEIKTEKYFYAPSASELDQIYQTIAEDLIYEVQYDILMIKITLYK